MSGLESNERYTAGSLDPHKIHQKIVDLKNQLSSVIFGQKELIEESICCLLAGGHALITGAPGLAKTTLIKHLAEQFQLGYKRIQFTPDVLPSDIIGSQMLEIDPETGKRHFSFDKGPIFTNFLLADEINRASPKTQSALLEAMQEKHCTVSGEVHAIPEPFMVFATQNPLESDGTFVLPEAQLDRFLVHILVDYPDYRNELRILEAHAQNQLAGERKDKAPANPTISDFELQECQQVVRNISVPDGLLEVCLDLIRRTRPADEAAAETVRTMVLFGGGPRAGISLIAMAKAYAYLSGDSEVRWRHIERMVRPVLRHRIRLTAKALFAKTSEDQVIDTVVDTIQKTYAKLS